MWAEQEDRAQQAQNIWSQMTSHPADLGQLTLTPQGTTQRRECRRPEERGQMGLKWCAHHTGPAPTHQVPRCPPKFLNGISQDRREHVLLLSPADSAGCDIREPSLFNHTLRETNLRWGLYKEPLVQHAMGPAPRPAPSHTGSLLTRSDWHPLICTRLMHLALLLVQLITL